VEYEAEQVQSIKMSNLQDVVREQLKHHILDSNLKTGDPLPTEKWFSEQLGISRTVVRESLKSLQAVGMIDVKQGVGYFVKEFNLEAILSNLPYMLEMHLGDFNDVLEIRIALESHYLTKLIADYTEEDIARLDEILVRLERLYQGTHSDQDLIDIHTEFHCELYRRTGNVLLVSLIKIFSTIQKNLTLLNRYQSTDAEFVELHRSIVRALATHDSQAARERLLVHFREAVNWSRTIRKEASGSDVVDVPHS
jgi:GntR family transcriptional repressor for pyruvate dehydrogenase complex